MSATIPEKVVKTEPLLDAHRGSENFGRNERCSSTRVEEPPSQKRAAPRRASRNHAAKVPPDRPPSSSEE
eukprot:CAMPEP_0119264506 /NCGR_PEP_ID=MMETSP1329-20130426/3576_1 /TAXON_ID=114041 /ORGANISM="Genus nov. species nov., Strain RCC1024" /LENGTH=69 /DNA_ID=CAMNT_0007264279 /DNA_START=16 /DNA_END=223 /DNA_ORIENTATION=-